MCRSTKNNNVVIHADNMTSILSSITTRKSQLADFIDPDFGLLDHLRSAQVLTPRQIADVRSERTVYRRNDALLDLLTTEDQCVKFLKALQQTGQQHVVNFITQNGGQKHHDLAPEIFAIKVGGCIKSTEILHVFGPQFFWGSAPGIFGVNL